MGEELTTARHYCAGMQPQAHAHVWRCCRNTPCCCWTGCSAHAALLLHAQLLPLLLPLLEHRVLQPLHGHVSQPQVLHLHQPSQHGIPAQLLGQPVGRKGGSKQRQHSSVRAEPWVHATGR